MARRVTLIVVVLAIAAAAAWGLFVFLPRLVADRTATATTAEGAPESRPAEPQRKITATLFYISEDGMSLVATKREVPFGEAPAEQARAIVAEQLREAPAPLASAIPAGTALRALFIGERGDAFVDLSGDVRARHTGGTLDELFTVYAIVNALTVNLPAITRVQILIDGQEVDTLAGHVDLRHPLQKSLKWVNEE